MLLRSAQNPNKLSMVEHYYDQRYGCKVLKVTFPIMQSVPFHILCMKLLFYCRRQHLNITTGQDGVQSVIMPCILELIIIFYLKFYFTKSPVAIAIKSVTQ